MDSEESISVVDRIWKEIVIQGNLQIIENLATDDYVYRGPGGLELHGPEGFRRLIKTLHDLVDDVEITIDEYIADGNRVLSRWSGKGKDPKTGRKITWGGATITHVENGKMADDWEYWDRLDLAKQLSEGIIERWMVDTVENGFMKKLPGD